MYSNKFKLACRYVYQCLPLTKTFFVGEGGWIQLHVGYDKVSVMQLQNKIQAALLRCHKVSYAALILKQSSVKLSDCPMHG